MIKTWYLVIWIIQIQETREKLWLGQMTHPWVMDSNYLKYHPHRQRLWPGHFCLLYANCDLALGGMTLSQGHDTIVWNNIRVKYDSKKLHPWHIFWSCVDCDLDLGDITLVQGHCTLLGHEQPLCNIIQIQHDSKELLVENRLWLCVLCDLDLGDMTFIQSHNTPLARNKSGVKCYSDPT